MKLIHRLGFYSGGFIIGLIMLFFFLSGKKTSCDYGPSSRALKNIRLKERHFSEQTLKSLSENSLDTSAISILLQNGDVLFSESNTNLDSCNIYIIKGIVLEKKIKIKIENCEKVATVLEVKKLNK